MTKEVGKGLGANGGLDDYAARNEILAFMPKVFVDLYTALIGLEFVEPLVGGGLQHNQRDANSGSVDRVTTKQVEEGKLGRKLKTREGIAEWLCSCGVWTKDTSSFCADGDCQRPRVVGHERRLCVGVEAQVGDVVAVGQPKRVRVDTSETVTRGGAKGAAGGKREGARRRAVIGDEYALALRDRLDRGLRRVVRDVLKDVGLTAVYRPGSGAALIVEHVGTVDEAIKWRRCSRPATCGRILEERWLYCPHCGGMAVDDKWASLS